MAINDNERISSQVMELKDLIAGPLVATIEADALSAQRYLDYLFRVAFETYDAASGKAGKLRMLTFDYNANDITGQYRRTISIPLLSLIPLPLLQVQEADFDFDIRVLEASSTQQKSVFSFSEGTDRKDDTERDFRLRVAMSPSHRNGKESYAFGHSMDANMKVHVKMKQADMPGGLSVLLGKAVNNMVTDRTCENERKET